MIDDIWHRLSTLLPALGQSLLISAAVLLTMLAVEALLVGWPESSLRRLFRGGASSYTDCLSALLVLTNASLLIGTALSFGLVYLLQRALREQVSFNLLSGLPLPWLAYLFFLLALDFSNYWTHRLMHRIGPLWEIHKYHHSAEHMTMLTALRDHPLERVLIHGMNAIPAALLGLPAQQYILLRLALQALGFLKHSNFHSNWGWLGRWFIQSPSAHRAHHSMAPEHHNRNFASIFQCWDVLFGTAYHPRKEVSRSIEIGLDPGYRSNNPLHLLVQTVRDFYRALLRPARRTS